MKHSILHDSTETGGVQSTRMRRSTAERSRVLVLVAITLTALNLRPLVTSVGAVLAICRPASACPTRRLVG